MPTQLDLFAADIVLDTYHITAPRIVCGDSHSGVAHGSGYAVGHTALSDVKEICEEDAHTVVDSGMRVLPRVLRSLPVPPKGNRPVVTVQGQLLSVEHEWSGKHGREIFEHLLTEAVGVPVGLCRISTPRSDELDVRRTGKLYRVGGRSRDLIVRLSSGGSPDTRQAKVSLHLNRRLYDEMRRYRTAIQAVVTRVQQPGRLDLLVTAAIPFAVLEPIVAERLATAPDGRAALSLEVRCTPSGLALRIPEADLDVSHYAGVETLATELRRDPGAPWRSLSHADWMGIVASVLTLRDGYHCSVAPLDSHHRVSRAVLEELGIRGVYGHRIGLPPASKEALVYTDVIAAPCSPDLQQCPAQPLVAIEIDAKSDMTAVQELALRLRSAERLGLNLVQGIVVADEAKREKFDERRSLLRDDYRDRLQFWSMCDVYEAYCVARDERLRSLTLEQRAAVRRAA